MSAFSGQAKTRRNGSETAKEKEDMLKAVTVKTDGGNQISMSTDRFLTLYENNGTPVEKLLETELPCNESVISTTGDPSPSRSSKATFP